MQKLEQKRSMCNLGAKAIAFAEQVSVTKNEINIFHRDKENNVLRAPQELTRPHLSQVCKSMKLCHRLCFKKSHKVTLLTQDCILNCFSGFSYQSLLKAQSTGAWIQLMLTADTGDHSCDATFEQCNIFQFQDLGSFYTEFKERCQGPKLEFLLGGYKQTMHESKIAMEDPRS